MIRRSQSAGLALLLCSLAPLSAEAETRFALIVGHNLGDAQETPLHWAEADAERVQHVLTQIGGVRSDRTMVLLSPTVTELQAAYQQMKGRLSEAKSRGEHTMLFFYYSGHADSEALHLGTETVSIKALTTELRSAPASTTLAVIDACRNNRTPRSRSKGAVRAPGFAWPEVLPEGPTGFVLLTSAAQGEVAQESDDLQGSLFTHHLLSGMRGSADVDGDGTVTLSELYNYGYRQTLSDTHRRATAVQHGEAEIDLLGRGALIVTYPKRSGCSCAVMMATAAD